MFLCCLPIVCVISLCFLILQAKYSQQFGTPIKVHPNSSPLDVAQLNPDESLLQITVLKPCWPQEQDKYRQSYKERNTNLRMRRIYVICICLFLTVNLTFL